MPRLVIISDTHNRHREISLPDGDILLHCGDSSNSGTRNEEDDFEHWFSQQPHERKVLISGNHDFGYQRAYQSGCFGHVFATDGGTHVNHLMDTGITIRGLHIYGSPWTPRFGDWAFMLDRGEQIKSKWDLIPEGVDVLLTHGPPKGIFDRPFSRYENVGCDDLLIKVLQIKPRIHAFGHIHGDSGMKEFNGTQFINASQVGEDYKIRYEPVVIDL